MGLLLDPPIPDYKMARLVDAGVKDIESVELRSTLAI
jgi:hypothetical protein